jgi:hypothetical protein
MVVLIRDKKRDKKVRGMVRKILAGAIVALCISTLSFAGDVESISEAIAKSEDRVEQAQLYKKMGDRFVAMEDYTSAADAYIEALTRGRDLFTPAERVKIAVYLSWANRLDEAIYELRLVLEEDGANREARVSLARVLSWSGRNDEAIREADAVLSDHPENRDAMLVKANALRWRGDVSKSIPLYLKILEKGEQFDSRLGLTHAFLEDGHIDEARQSVTLLKPKYGYQKRALKKLKIRMNRESRPNFVAKYSYYNDTDENEVHRFGISQNYWAGRWRSAIHFRHTTAEDPIRKNRAREVWAKSYGKASDYFSAGGGLGLSQFVNGKKREIITGHVRGDFRILKGKIGASLAQDIFSDTAELIENRIYYSDAGIYFSQNITQRLGLSLSYNYRDYSDENSSNSVQFLAKYLLFRGKAKITVGARNRYVDFNRQSRGGYFDPEEYYAYQAFVSLYSETEKYYLYLEPFFGYQSFTRFGEDTDDTFGGGFGSVGWKVTPDFTIELNGEGGNYALAVSSGFEYYLVGVNVNVYF